MADTKELHHHGFGAIRRKRGRPSGHNRLPLGLEQRRAQNAQYERERREEERASFAELAEAVCADSSWSKGQILDAAIDYLQRAIVVRSKRLRTLEDIRRQNDNLKEQIKMLVEHLEKS